MKNWLVKFGPMIRPFLVKALMTLACVMPGVALAVDYIVSGTLTTNTGSAMNGVAVSLHGVSPFSTTTATDGTYTFSAAPTGNYTLTASKTDYVWTPGSRVFTLSANLPGQNFVGSLASVFQDTAYTFLAKWGGLAAGAGTSQFNFPNDVALDASGNIYVVDLSNNRIQKFNSSTEYVTQWGFSGTGEGGFSSPQGLAVDASGNVYVADTGHSLIQKFTSTGGYTLQWGGLGSGNNQLNAPRGVAVDAEGNVYVVDYGNTRIMKYNSTGTYMTKWDGSGTTGNLQLNSPIGIAVDGSGKVFVVDSGNSRILKFTSTGVFITQWGSSGSEDSQFSVPQGVAVDASGNIYVVDGGNNRIQKFSSVGITLMAKWGSSGTDNGKFSSARGIAVDASGKVYVADSGNHRIQKFSPGIQTYAVSGTLTANSGPAMSGIAMSLHGVTSFSTTTASNGTYTFAVAPPGTYTLTAVNTAYVFNPTSLTLTLSADLPGQNMVVSRPTFAITLTPRTGRAGNSVIVSAGLTGYSGQTLGAFFGVNADGFGGFQIGRGTLGTNSTTLSATTSVTATVGSHRIALRNDALMPPLISFTAGFSITAVDLTLGSSAFQMNGVIPKKYSKNDANLSPPLIWGNAPSGTQSFALIMDDPDAGNFLHWMAYDLSATLTGLAEGVPGVATMTVGGKQGPNDFGTIGYGGPQPPSGIHNYSFRVYALDQATLDVAANPTRAQVLQALQGRILAQAELVGFYSATPTYTVSGTLTSNTGSAMSGVTVTLYGGGVFAGGTTGSDGTFAAARSAGTSTLSVSKADYVFTPGSRVITGTVDLTGQNFVGTPAFIFQSTSYSFDRKWGSFGSGDGQFNAPLSLNIAVDASGNVYATDGENRRVQKFSSSGDFLLKWGSLGGGDGRFSGAFAFNVAVDASGNVYVADNGAQRVQKFSSFGDFILKWGSSGSEDGQFSTVVPGFDVAVDASGNVYVVDNGNVNRRIQKFSSSGGFLAKWGSNGLGDGQFSIPQGIAIDASGNVYVVDKGNNRIQKFSSSGGFLAKWGSSGLGDGQFNGPLDVAVDVSGNVYVADGGNNRIQKFSSRSGIPANFIGSALSPTSIAWSWTDTNTTELTYFVHDVSHAPLITLAANAIGWTETGLAPNTAYTRHANVVDALGNVDSNSYTVYTLADVPSNLTLVGRASTRLTLAWSGNGTRYALYRATTGSSFSSIKIWSDNQTSTMYVDTGLTPATTYLYQVAAYNGDQTLSALSALTLTGTTGPGAPGAPTAGVIATNLTALTFSWTAGAGAATYDVQIGTTLAGADFFNSSVGTSLFKAMDQLQNGSTYYCRVRAVDAGGATSDWVASAGAIVDLTPPTAPAVGSSTHFNSEVAYVESTAKLSLVPLTDASGIVAYRYTLDASRSETPSASTLVVTTDAAIITKLSGDGIYILTVSAQDGAGNVSTVSVLTLQLKTAVLPNIDNHFLVGDGSGVVIPAGNVTTTTKFLVDTAATLPPAVFQSTQWKAGQKVFDLKLGDGTSQFNKPVTLTMSYVAADIAGLNENRLALGYYDETKSTWVALKNSKVFPSLKKVVATTTHFSLFGFLEFTSGGAGVLQAYNYPNPFPPTSGTTIRYVLGETGQTALIKIFRVDGQLVRELPGTADVDLNDVVWDGRDRFGQSVFSEVLLAIIEVTKTNGDKTRRTIKMMGWQ